jgi:hypothetical protein
MSYCPTCRESTFTLYGKHQCLPCWDWRVDDYHGPDDWNHGEIRARDAEDAAIRAAEIYDQEEHYLLRQETTVEIFVRNVDTGVVSRWRCSGEAIPTYRAEAVAETPSDAGGDSNG